MITDSELREMQELVNELNRHCYNYYVMDNPTISDYEYDVVNDRLLEMEARTGVVLPDSPSLRVGGDVLEGFEKITHKIKLNSLAKVNQKDDLIHWCNDVIEEHRGVEFAVEYKFDGLRLALTYKGGKLVRAGTRGNGVIGEDVTAQVRTIKTAPLSIEYRGELIVEGEGMMLLGDLAEYNRHANEPLKNARNAVAGAIRNLDPKVTARRKLNLFFYEISYIDDISLVPSQRECYDFLKHNGFQMSFARYAKSAEEVWNIVETINSERKTLDYLTDGAVIKVVDYNIRQEMGSTIKHPRWAMAFKFEAEEISTDLLDVVWQVGRTGKITPSADLEPVTLAGALISRATLNNIGDIRRKKLMLPCRVFLRRSNEVIPEILGIAELLPESEPIVAPTHCPSCNASLVTRGANLFCVNPECPEQIRQKIIHFASRNAMNIEDISDKTVGAFYDVLSVRKFSDLYRLSIDDLRKLDAFREKKSKKVYDHIEKSKRVKLANFLYAISISNIGVKTAKDLANHFGSLQAVREAEFEELVSIFDIGDVVARDVYDYFRNIENVAEIDRLIELGVEIENAETIKNDSFAYGLKFVLTGTLSTMSRNEATELLESKGAQVLSSVSANCDYVVFGENAGSKLAKAQKLGVATLSEEEFLTKLKSE